MKQLFSILSPLGLLFLGETAGAKPAVDGADRRLGDAIALLEEGFSVWEPKAFEEPIRRFDELCQAGTDVAPWYWSAVSQFHRILCLRAAEGDGAGAEHWEKTLRTLDRALELDAKNAECYVMRGVINGMRIARQPASALWLGRKVLGDQRLALQLGSGSPRVRYLNGVSGYRASKGKDAEIALRELLEAERLFQEEGKRPREPLAPRWGQDHCLYFMAEIHRSEGNVPKSVEYYQKALSANPRLEKARLALRQLSAL